MTLFEYITEQGYTKEEWEKCVGELWRNGFIRGNFDDYDLAKIAIKWLYNLEGRM